MARSLCWPSRNTKLQPIVCTFLSQNTQEQTRGTELNKAAEIAFGGGYFNIGILGNYYLFWCGEAFCYFSLYEFGYGE